MLLQPYGLCPILNIKPNFLQACLIQLETKTIIQQKCEVSPEQLVRCWDNPLKLLEQAYQK
ncbi:MAG: hypothetical protein J7647_28625 [Cyanobacteria bacterium SBLK]|nr:hypothetical protein [Cyanobacteria bacterium SBLK]